MQALVTDGGTLVERYEYEPYGKVTLLDASGAANPDPDCSEYGDPWTFTGRRLNQGRALLRFQNRERSCELLRGGICGEHFWRLTRFLGLLGAIALTSTSGCNRSNHSERLVSESWPLSTKEAKALQSAAAAAHGVPIRKRVSFGPGVSISFVLIPAGEVHLGMAPPLPPADWSATLAGLLCALGVLVLGVSIWSLVHVASRTFATKLLALFGLAMVGSGAAALLLHDRDRDRFRREGADYAAVTGDVGKPGYRTTIKKAFYMSEQEISLEEWVGTCEFVSDNPPLRAMETEWRKQYQKDFGRPADDPALGQLPAEEMSWRFAKTLLQAASAKSGLVIRLPREAEWEWACRAGSVYRHPLGLDASPRSRGPTSVCDGPVSGFGVRNMPGNVMEWCEDMYVASDKDRAKIEDIEAFERATLLSLGEGPRPTRVARGLWYFLERAEPLLACTYRHQCPEDVPNNIGMGCRLVLELP